MTNTEFVTRQSFGHRFYIQLSLYYSSVTPGSQNWLTKVYLHAAPVSHLEAQNISNITFNIPDNDSVLSPGCTVLVLLVCRDLKRVFYAPVNEDKASSCFALHQK